MFYMARQLSAGENSARIERFDELWKRPATRRTFRIVTAVWAAGWLSEAALPTTARRRDRRALRSPPLDRFGGL